MHLNKKIFHSALSGKILLLLFSAIFAIGPKIIILLAET